MKNPKLPLVAVNTTAGTGSEVTRFAIITDPVTSVKMLLADPRLIPDVAIDDPLLTVTCPPLITASTGLDAAGPSEMVGSQRAVSEVRALCRDLEIPGLSGLGIEPDKLMALAPTMAQDALDSGSPGNNPRVPTVEEIAALYHQAL